MLAKSRVSHAGITILVLGVVGLLVGCGKGGLGEGGGDDGSHYPGANCLSGGCHAGGEHSFAFAGTVYKDAAGTTALPGATVTITVGTTNYTLVSDSLGNFYMGGLPSTSTYKSHVTGPSGVPINMSTQPNNAGCNSCHNPSGGSTGRIFAN